ncbi:efflux transporter outer membrane subunit [Corticibacter populi]|uniref:Efflux transporter outer membrane subunit n=1 Tax=Corticibacter populi TaxID=1550736 RepID=A0A3M6QHR1_9BURK|nr:efflux transporter outer membrane subunit [Corticibacter populi]RMX02633.1 efflux transporter outer membrane subunit [Corticibacter populi]RZS32949.1 NodT family efflux transporter outer membrane factor (OMF) lipoprotein [Corticibacter populi]
MTKTPSRYGAGGCTAAPVPASASASGHRHPLAWLWLPVLASALAACADFSGIDPQAELRSAASLGLPVPQATSGSRAESDTAAPDTVDAVDAINAHWWRQLGDARLDALVEQALAGNPAIGLAQSRLEKALAQAGAVRANDWPQLAGEASVTRQHFTAHGMVPAPLAGSVANNALAQLGASWELDWFGQNRAALEAAIGSARAAAADAQAARVLLASQVVQTYVELARWQAQLDVAERTLAQRSETLDIVRQRFDAGLDAVLELRQSEGGLPQARAQIEQIHEQIALTRNALAALIGTPQSAPELVATDLPALRMAALPGSLPADLLGRRADVVAARWRVEAAQQGIEEARAAFYPNVSLTAFLGLSSLDLGRWIEGGSRQWGVGPAISLPIFEGGRLRANLGARAADHDAAVEGYNQAIIAAVHEAADQLASIEAIARQQREQQQALEVAQSAYEIARARYAAGLTPYLSVLTTEAAVLAERRQHVDLAARALQARVALAHALGGGYEPSDTPFPAPFPAPLSPSLPVASHQPHLHPISP